MLLVTLQVRLASDKKHQFLTQYFLIHELVSFRHYFCKNIGRLMGQRKAQRRRQSESFMSLASDVDAISIESCYWQTTGADGVASLLASRDTIFNDTNTNTPVSIFYR